MLISRWFHISFIINYCWWKKSCITWHDWKVVFFWDIYHISWCRIFTTSWIQKKHRQWKQPNAELVSRISSNQKNSQKHPLLHYICVSHCFRTRINHLSGFWVEKPFWDLHFFYIIQIEILQSIKSRTDALNIILEHLQTCDTMSSSKSLNDDFFDWSNHDHFLISHSPRSLQQNIEEVSIS